MAMATHIQGLTAENCQIRHNIQSPLLDIGQIDQIYHLACPASPIQYQKDHISTLRTCFLGTDNLLSLAKARNIRMLHTSTSGRWLLFPRLESEE